MSNPKPSTGFHTNPERINRNGPPKKGYSITEMMKRLLTENPDIRERIGQVVLAKAMKGDLAAIDKVWKYMDGMPTQSMEVDGSIEHRLTYHEVVKLIDDNARTDRDIEEIVE